MSAVSLFTKPWHSLARIKTANVALMNWRKYKGFGAFDDVTNDSCLVLLAGIIKPLHWRWMHLFGLYDRLQYSLFRSASTTFQCFCNILFASHPVLGLSALPQMSDINKNIGSKQSGFSFTVIHGGCILVWVKIRQPSSKTHRPMGVLWNVFQVENRVVTNNTNKREQKNIELILHFPRTKKRTMDINIILSETIIATSSDCI